MDSRSFLGLQQSHNPCRWWLPVTTHLCTGGGFLFGGGGPGAAIAAMGGTSGREGVWATSPYLEYARPDEGMDIDVRIAVEGHQITQARAVCHVGRREILTVNAALGNRPIEQHGQWVAMPDVPPPDECTTRPHRMPVEGTVHERMEQRLAKGREFDELDGTHGDGRVLMWAQVPSVIASETHLVDAVTLAILGDFVPMGVGQALGVLGGGNSLDNTIRVGRLVPTQWVLLDIQVHAVERGFGHGLVHMFAEDGTLLATASQSCIVRMWKGDRAAAPRPRRDT